MTIETTPFDPADYLDSPDIRQAYLAAALEDGDPVLVAAVIEDIAKSIKQEQTQA